MMKLLLLSLLFVGILCGGNGHIVTPQVGPVRHIRSGLHRGPKVHLGGIVQRIRTANLKIGQLRALRGKYRGPVIRGRMSRRHIELKGLRGMLGRLRARLQRELATENHIVHLAGGKLRSASKLFYAMQTKLRQSQSLFMSAKRGLASATRHRARARAHVQNEMLVIERVLLMLTGVVTRGRRGVRGIKRGLRRRGGLRRVKRGLRVRRGLRRGLRRGKRGLRRSGLGIKRPFVRRAASTLSVKSGTNSYQPAGSNAGSGSVKVTPPTTLSVSSQNVFSAPQPIATPVATPQGSQQRSAQGSVSVSDDAESLDEEDTLEEEEPKALNEEADLLEIEEDIKPEQTPASTGSSSPTATASASV